ncbi:hypothetical protein [Rhizobium herbae]|uniref:DUF982 domain-containing protein n=1 Tax=Rhizobium herbae TaxID=508661 RepID=A0ABS4EU65_9HYPH|nr:hypothetical protein [Rhizobium herbae]MBP1861499.1 hypothetical protein [Rhizobium herbae]
MAKVFIDTNEIEFDLSSSRCRGDVERAFHSMLIELCKKGWHPAAVAMALADTAEDFIMELAEKPSRNIPFGSQTPTKGTRAH